MTLKFICMIEIKLSMDTRRALLRSIGIELPNSVDPSGIDKLDKDGTEGDDLSYKEMKTRFFDRVFIQKDPLLRAYIDPILLLRIKSMDDFEMVNEDGPLIVLTSRSSAAPPGRLKKNGIQELSSELRDFLDDVSEEEARRFTTRKDYNVPDQYLDNASLTLAVFRLIKSRFKGADLTFNSGYRSPQHNAQIGGAPNSQHLYAQAVDIGCPSSEVAKLFLLIDKLIEEGVIPEGQLICYTTFCHFGTPHKRSRLLAIRGNGSTVYKTYKSNSDFKYLN